MCVCARIIHAALFHTSLLARAAPGCARKHAFGITVAIWTESSQAHNTGLRSRESETEPEQSEQVTSICESLFLFKKNHISFYVRKGRGKQRGSCSVKRNKNI